MNTLDLSVGDRHTVRLHGRGTAGYAWSAIVDDPQIASVTFMGTAPPESSTATGAPGFSASRDEIFQVIALAAGGTTLHFTQSRPWEKNKPPITSADYAIVVRE
ncbi:MAG TPA: protease inhibitor I42 family protein [Candidatus Dormibacteraeota bacterium]|nr:protease inhibitor I42 family protein [Candidatus Dormibacteraeota bacterium]